MSSQNDILGNRRELIFLYDVMDANPNGDPDDSNRPRMDDGYNIVTDVRLKRTIRDYWLNCQNSQKIDGMDIIVHREIVTGSTDIKPMEDLVIDALKLDKNKLADSKEKTYKGDALATIINKLPNTFYDVRTFGAAVTVKGATHQFTGPVQFGIGRSLNKPEIKSHTITTTFASGTGKGAGTFGEFHVVDYSLLMFHGIVCEYTAKKTGFSNQDLNKLFIGMWDGTKMLNTRSKFNHVPRLLISVKSKEKNFQIGGLDRTISLINNDAKNIEDSKTDFTKFIDRLNEFSDKIDAIEIKTDPQFKFYKGATEFKSLKEMLASETKLKSIQIIDIKW